MTLVLLHGALGGRDQLDALGTLVARRRPVLPVEFEGHGRTPARDRLFSVDGFVENVVAALDSAGLEKADVFGYSMGGYVALALAHPVRVRTITTLGTRLAWNAELAAHEAERFDAETIRTTRPAWVPSLAERHAGAGGWEATAARTSAFVRALGDGGPLQPAVLATIQHRTRIMVGDRDTTVSIEESAAAFRQLPAGELMVLPRTPHAIERVDAYRLADVLIELIS